MVEIYEILDSAYVTGRDVAELFTNQKDVIVDWQEVQGDKGKTDFIKIIIKGTNGFSKGGSAPTLGIVGRLGGIGARPDITGLVSDADGAVAALACALKLTSMKSKGDSLSGDVIITTHICPDAPTRPHIPVPFMDSPVDMIEMNKYEIDLNMDAILSVDTTKGNRLLNHKGIAISPTVKEGYILPVSKDLLEITEIVTGKSSVVLPITTQDITPYGNGLYHINSILQPAVATDAPVAGVAITAETAVPGCATGASHIGDIDAAARFCIEVAKRFGKRECAFYNQHEFDKMVKLYGSMKHLQTLGKTH